MRIAIYGAGSLGTVLGAYLAEAHLDVVLITRNVDHVAALQEQGAFIIGAVEKKVPVKAITPDQMTGQYDVVLLLTKQLDNKSVVRFLAPKISADGVLCTLQNGLPEPDIVAILGARRVLGCAVGWGATLVQPGVVEVTSGPDTFVFNLGMPDGGDAQKLEIVQKILEHMGKVVIQTNFIGARWAKLIVNASFSTMATIIGKTFGDVARNKVARRYAQLIVKECIDVTKALQITIEPIQGKDIVRFFDYQTKIKRWISFHLMPLAINKHQLLRPGMLQDIHNGKPCEIDAINGVVSRYGKLANVPTRYNDRALAIVHRIEKGELPAAVSNLRFFSDPA